MYNPYDLLELLINGQPMYGRPIELDSEIVDQHTMRNAFGSLPKPSKVSTVCPDCGQGLVLSVNLGEPPFDTIAISCEHCYPAPPPQIDPFMNPIKDCRIPIESLNPMAHKYDKPLVEEHIEPVAARVDFDIETIPESPEFVIPDIKAAFKAEAKEKKKKKNEKKKNIEPADGITEEVDEDRLV